MFIFQRLVYKDGMIVSGYMMEQEQTQERPRFTDPRYFSQHRYLEYLFVLSACLGQVLVQAGSMYTMSIMNVISEYYGTSREEGSWYTSSFALTVGSLILISGRFGDVYGSKLVIILGYLWTILWSALSGVAFYTRQSPDFYMICRAFQGCGLAFVFPNIIGAVGRVYTPQTLRKHIVFSLIGWSAPLGGTSGPFFAGLISVKTTHWDWASWAFLITSVIAILLTWVSCPEFPADRDKPLDWFGCILVVSGLVLLNFVMNQAPIVGWSSAYIITLLPVSVVILLIFVVFELKFASNPIIPPQVLKNVRLGLCLLTLFVSWGSFGVLAYRLYTFLLNIRHYTPLAAGASTMPGSVTGFIAAMSTTICLKLIGLPMLLILSMASFTATNILVLTLPVHQKYFRQTFGIFFVGAFGMDWSFTSGTILLSDTLPQHIQGMAGSLVMATTCYGIAFFIGLDATVEQQVTLRHPGNSVRIHRDSSAFGVGLAGLSIVIAVILAAIEFFAKRRKEKSIKDINES